MLARRAFWLMIPFTLTQVGAQEMTVAVKNLSRPTLCAEEDNVNIPLFGSLASFTVEARHPTYEVGVDSCLADFTNCTESDGFLFGDSQQVWKLWDDGVTSVEAVREPRWWRPRGMHAAATGGQGIDAIHFVRLRRQIAGTSEFPEVFVLNMDGNVRLKPQPPLGQLDTCFGSSVIIGPASSAARPIAEIASVQYVPGQSAFEVEYITGGSATLRLSQIDREVTKLEVDARYPVDNLPFATFRSMFVSEGNSDVDQAAYLDTGGLRWSQPILELQNGLDSSEWEFSRRSRSAHNTSAPDIFVREFSASSLCGKQEAFPTLCLQSQRFKVEVEWSDFSGGNGYGRSAVSAKDSGIIWFFSRDNWEMVVKVLNGCSINDRFWVFASTATTVEFTLRITDLQAQKTVSYRNPLGNVARTITDTDAFATCP